MHTAYNFDERLYSDPKDLRVKYGLKKKELCTDRGKHPNPGSVPLPKILLKPPTDAKGAHH
jgi:hypothetical protein